MMSTVLTWMRIQWFSACLLLGYAFIFWWKLAGYVNFRSVDFQLGILALFVVISSSHSNKKGGSRFAIAAIAAAAMTFLLPVKTMLYVAVLLAVFFWVETHAGKMHLLSLLVILLVSPVCRYITNIFSFPIRLSITKCVGVILSFTGHDSIVEGNIILYNGNEFSVDPACMGLYMLITSLLSGIMIVALQQRKCKRCLRAAWIVVLLIFVVVCNVLCNLFRIFILVYYKILPDTVMHDVAGIICFIVYVVVPVLAFSGWMIKRYGRSYKTLLPDHKNDKRSAGVYLHVVVTIFCTMAAVVSDGQRKNKSTETIVDNKSGYTISTLQGNITKMENEHALVYIKSMPGFYSSDHHPMICWGGSGYEFTKVHTDLVGGREVYAGILSKGDEKLYTAWWYDNGDHHTIEQWNWRWDMLKGSKPYALVNITAENPTELKKQVEYFISNR